MSVDAFEKTNFGWQMQQQLQQLGEWVELKFSQVHPPELPNVSLPSWLSELLRLLWPLEQLWLYKKVLFWLVVGLLLSWIAWQVWRVWGHHLSSFPSLLQTPPKAATSGVSQLTVSAWLSRSQEFYRQGNYGEASRSLYMAMLQKLHDAGIASHQSSRTDGEYRQLTRELPQEASYQTLLATHEQLCFGGAEVSSEDFAQCQQAYQEIHGQEATPPNPPAPRGRNRS